MIVKLLAEHHFGVSKLKRRLQRLVIVFTCQNVKLLEISCNGSNDYIPHNKWQTEICDISENEWKSFFRSTKKMA